MVDILWIKIQGKSEFAKSHTEDAEKEGSGAFPVCMFPRQKSAQSVKAHCPCHGFKSRDVKSTFA